MKVIITQQAYSDFLLFVPELCYTNVARLARIIKSLVIKGKKERTEDSVVVKSIEKNTNTCVFIKCRIEDGNYIVENVFDKRPEKIQSKAVPAPARNRAC